MKHNREFEDLDNLPLVDSSDEEGQQVREDHIEHLKAIKNLNIAL